jgi:hypothetical protein
VTADGDVIQEHGSLAKLSPEDQFEEQTSVETSNDQFCNNDFPVGLDKTSNCTNGGVNNEILIDGESMCQQAAEEAGARIVDGKFTIATWGDRQYWEPKRPMGCFKEACASGTGTCYYFNAVGYWPTAIDGGQPICNRPKHVNGTKNVAGGCPAGYAVIDDEDTCRSAANCLQYTQADEFRIGTLNGSRHLDFVRGCFFDEEADGSLTVYYNAETNLGDCTTCKGTQICNVTSTVSW